ncbi:recombinase family protein [Amylolactobacillus amylophilus]|uniref:recombinase family protein n=1 Tax=Amylolactobacillus amylophilus TaxID=1603 RepID=UPI000ADF3E45|nr:recombinase family protein [Amylolactobacillus amylophilus]
MQIGYARVSSTDQNLDRQLKQFEGLGIKKIFAEKISGKDRSRPKLREMLQYIHDDDEVVVTSLDRLGRNSQDLTTIIEEIRSKGAVINILDLPTFDGVQDKNLKALLSNLVMEIYKYTAEEERKKNKITAT